ncbi:DsbA family oxidoreductase [Brevibacillus dissolubilis]|uniref:DsbA family oxidoreductase n=1 Tax=Brevibacillus dissolubilis TaxID=1844116 RepID=UPI00111672DC|nr:DsbA family oxidoreductase [Brevibacillus dissolubilis]
MKVEIWSDFICPFCYIGKRRFEAALEQFAHKQEIEVIYRSFELDPNAKREATQDIHSMLAGKYGMSLEQAKSANADVGRQAEGVGLTYDFDNMKPSNTFDAHRLSHYAASHGRMQEMTERLLYAYFTEGKHLGDHETLTALAAEVGLDRDEVAKMLSGEDFTQEVRSDEQEAVDLGIRGVPFFVINRRYAVSGAQPSEVFLDALKKAWDEQSPLTILNEASESADDAACVDGVCATDGDKQKQ